MNWRPARREKKRFVVSADLVGGKLLTGGFVPLFDFIIESETGVESHTQDTYYIETDIFVILGENIVQVEQSVQITVEHIETVVPFAIHLGKGFKSLSLLARDILFQISELHTCSDGG